MTQITKPILLDETGQAMVQKLTQIANLKERELLTQQLVMKALDEIDALSDTVGQQCEFTLEQTSSPIFSRIAG